MSQVPKSALLEMSPAKCRMLSEISRGSSALVSKQRQTASEEKTMRKSEKQRGNLLRGKVIRG
jgi:hypothetical protein